MVLPITVGVLAALFAVQRFGTAGVGSWFGPITLVWFIVLFAAGPQSDRERAAGLGGFLPQHALTFALHHGVATLFALGAVTLAVTGAEALYADMGHFGRSPIRRAWLWLVLPALLANYYGQGALLLAEPERHRQSLLPIGAGMGALSAGRRWRPRPPSSPRRPPSPAPSRWRSSRPCWA